MRDRTYNTEESALLGRNKRTTRSQKVGSLEKVFVKPVLFFTFCNFLARANPNTENTRQPTSPRVVHQGFISALETEVDQVALTITSETGNSTRLKSREILSM